jgi:flagellar assembly protein FliH
MQSPSEDAVSEQSRRAVTRSFEEEDRSVSRLEFALVEDVAARSGKTGRTSPAAILREEMAALEERLRKQTEALPVQMEEARRLARLLARKEWEQELQQRITEERAMVRRACDEFERERTRYFAAVEAQVVKLSLAIAARVLHREAKMDPLLLSAAVRVALEKVKEESETRLRVPMAEASLWHEVFDTGEESAVQIVAEDGLARGECVLETSVGTVELGIEAQLAEIERGFFDLMQKRPA